MLPKYLMIVPLAVCSLSFHKSNNPTYTIEQISSPGEVVKKPIPVKFLFIDGRMFIINIQPESKVLEILNVLGNLLNTNANNIDLTCEGQIVSNNCLNMTWREIEEEFDICLSTLEHISVRPKK